MPTTERISLYYKAGCSDKEYHASIEPADSGFVVRFAYGRRGSTLQNGTKTPAPVEYAQAKKIYDRLVNEKLAKGYTPGEDGSPYQSTSHQERATGILPQLLNAIDEDQAQRLIADNDWLAQEKLDGRRVLILRKDDQIVGINRQGLVISLPEPVVQHARSLGSQQWLLDGEAVGDRVWTFDLLETACIDLRSQPYGKRLKALYELVGAGGAVGRQVRPSGSSSPGEQGRHRLQTFRCPLYSRPARQRRRSAQAEVHSHGLLHRRFPQRQTPKRRPGGAGWRKTHRHRQCDYPAQLSGAHCQSRGRDSLSLCPSRRQSLSAGLSLPAGRSLRQRLPPWATEVQGRRERR
jgi:predicted DNA-binding WGR domain protein